MKSEVASQLPIKEHKVNFVDMTTEQSDLYKSAVNSLRQDAAAANAAAAAQADAKVAARVAKAAAAAEAKAAAAARKKGGKPVGRVVVDSGDVAERAVVPKEEKVDGESALKRLGGAQANNIFTHLRKV